METETETVINPDDPFACGAIEGSYSGFETEAKIPRLRVLVF